MDKSLDEFVTVGKFLAPTEAQIAKGLLEAAGIDCILQGENANNMLALAFRARLKVRQRDEEAAIALLEATEGGLYDAGRGGFDA
ncbi:putative signal transducing protein [Granulicella arctica]|uniref:DUF2007 domain-containing protein n=1 Tax=Granulicella arctica TaxID=940613 RepID=A0A7Y9TST0_9BACT|nr:hypothetical protein [Granulicella arctica]